MPSVDVDAPDKDDETVNDVESWKRFEVSSGKRKKV